MKIKPENACRSCRTNLALYEFKTLTGKLIHVCGRCRKDLLELQMFIRGDRNPAMPPNDAIRFFRIPFVPETSLPHIDSESLVSSNAIESDALRKFPKSAFAKPDIAVLHKNAMKVAMDHDGVKAQSISRKAGIPKYAVDQFLNLQISDPKSDYFCLFMHWIINHGYTLNQIVHRPDTQTLFPDTLAAV